MDNRVKSLCKRAKRGDRAAACKLLKICYSDVFTYLWRLCGNRQDAEDLTQQTFLKVWSSLNSFREHSKFSTWLYRIAHNTYIDWQRRSTGEARNYSEPRWDECIDTNPGPFGNAADRQIAQNLYEAVEQLDDDKKQVVYLHYYEQLSIRQTAKVLNVATSTIKYRLREVMKVLRARIDTEKNEINKRVIPVPQGEKT